MPEAVLHDGSTIEITVDGEGPALLLPVDPRPAEGAKAAELAKWGADPALGRSLIDGLSDRFRVVAAHYEGHVFATPKPDTLTPANLAADLLAIADAAGADRFAYYGYSWLAVAGLQLAVRTDRLTALAMGGYPPLEGPYREMLQVTSATHAMAASTADPAAPAAAASTADPAAAEGDYWDSVELTLTEPQTRQFVTLYEELQTFDDRAALGSVTCPRLCFAGAADQVAYGERWGGVHVDLAGPLVRRRAELAAAGWVVHVLDGLDHMQAMQTATVLPILRPWLETALTPARP